jgi:hypothetical protein
VLGAGGDIVGVLFGQPLTAPPREQQNNKILWVSRLNVRSDPLKIDGKLTGTDVSATREVTEGPGPSIIDMPQSGCWSFTLSWSGHQDHLDVPYYPRP